MAAFAERAAELRNLVNYHNYKYHVEAQPVDNLAVGIGEVAFQRIGRSDQRLPSRRDIVSCS